MESYVSCPRPQPCFSVAVALILVPVLALAMTPWNSSTVSLPLDTRNQFLANRDLEVRLLSELGEVESAAGHEATGLVAELIRYHPANAAVQMQVKRSLARVRSLKRMMNARRLSMGTFSNVKFEEDPASGLGTDLTTGAPFEYLMKISIGSPPQHFLAVADTGSDIVWLRCRPCKKCQADVTLFEPTRSKSFSKLSCNSRPCHLLAMQYSEWVQCSSQCQYSYFYADNSSTAGDFAAETLQMKFSRLGAAEKTTTAIHNFAFGCGHNEFSPSMLYTNANGIIGLGKGLLSFPNQLGPHFGRKFSYCLVDRKKPGQVHSSSILFGNVAVPRVPGVQYTPFVDNPFYPTYYYLALEGILVGEQALDIPPRTFSVDTETGDGGTVIDSGTTYTQLVSPAYYALLRALNASITRYKRVMGYFDFCYDVTGVDELVSSVPRITLLFRDGAKMELPFDNAFILVRDDPLKGKVTMCLAINNSLDVDFNVIGNYQQTNFHILYDLQDKRLGFVPHHCSTVL